MTCPWMFFKNTHAIAVEKTFNDMLYGVIPKMPIRWQQRMTIQDDLTLGYYSKNAHQLAEESNLLW